MSIVMVNDREPIFTDALPTQLYIIYIMRIRTGSVMVPVSHKIQLKQEFSGACPNVAVFL